MPVMVLLCDHHPGEVLGEVSPLRLTPMRDSIKYGAIRDLTSLLKRQVRGDDDAGPLAGLADHVEQ